MQAYIQFAISIFLVVFLQVTALPALAARLFGEQAKNQQTVASGQVLNEQYRLSLVEMQRSDQDLRASFRSMTEGKNPQLELATNPSLRALALQIHSQQIDHQDRLKKMMSELGFPDQELVGIDGAHAAFLLVQHSPDRSVRTQFTLQASLAAEHGRFNKADLAYLIDRNLQFEGKTQVYGTQKNPDGSLYQIEAPESLTQRRLAMGLPAEL